MGRGRVGIAFRGEEKEEEEGKVGVVREILRRELTIYTKRGRYIYVWTGVRKSQRTDALAWKPTERKRKWCLGVGGRMEKVRGGDQ